MQLLPKEFFTSTRGILQDVVHRTCMGRVDDKDRTGLKQKLSMRIYSKALDQVEKDERMEEKSEFPANIDWDDIDSIATEARQKVQTD